MLFLFSIFERYLIYYTGVALYPPPLITYARQSIDVIVTTLNAIHCGQVEVSHLNKYVGHTSFYALLNYRVEIYPSAIARYTIFV